MRRLILRSFQSPGDVVMLTAAVRDLHAANPGQFETDVRTSTDALWEHNPHLTRLNEGSPGVESLDMHYPIIHESNHRPYHFIHAYPQFLEQQLGVRVPVTQFRGDLHLSAVEKSSAPLNGHPLPERFWIIVAGGKYDFTAKWWNPASYQKVVDHFRGRIQFVQVGEVGHWHPPLEGVLNLIGKTDSRQFVRLMHHAEGVVCPVTFAMHLAAAVETRPGRPKHRPCVVVAGGREPTQWEAYPQHQFISTSGMLSCCQEGGCWKSRCQLVGDGDAKDHHEVCEQPVQLTPELRIPKCLDLITAEDVIRKIEMYFQGGVMSLQPAPQMTARHEPARSPTYADNGFHTTDQKTPTRNILLIFRHGLGDAVQFTSVLLHLKHYHPDWNVDVLAQIGKHSAFEGLCRRVYLIDRDTPNDDYHARHDLEWHECRSPSGHGPSTKVARCLLEVFQLTPLPEWCRYKIEPSEEARQRARDYLSAICGPPNETGRYRAVLIHYEGNTSCERKNLSNELVREICDIILAANHAPVILDWDRRSPLPDGVRIHNPDADHPLWLRSGTGDAGTLAALIEASTLMIGVDSGPLHAAGATTTPTIGVWTGHHPVHYFDLAENVVHLVPVNHSDLVASSEALTYFDQNYHYEPYQDLNVDLLALVEHRLTGAAIDPIRNKRFLRQLNATGYNRSYYDEHKRAGLDYLGFGEWQQQYGRWIVDSLGYKGRRMLDVGCACGSILRGLGQAGAIVQGVDLCEPMIQLGRKQWPDMTPLLLVCDAVNLHLFTDQSWDGLHSAQVAEHWKPELVPFVLRELARVTVPGGLFFCALDTEESFARQGRTLEYEDPTHICIKPMIWWHEQLFANGWEVCTAEMEPILREHPEDFLSRYDWDFFIARRGRDEESVIAQNRSQTNHGIEEDPKAAVEAPSASVTDTSGLVHVNGFWIRQDNTGQDMVIVHDVADGDSYRIDEIPSPGPVVVDVGAHIGCFTKRLHQRNPQARIFAVECCPENLAALKMNVGEFATVIPAAMTYESDVALLNAVYGNCLSTGGSILMSREELRQRVDRHEFQEQPAPDLPGYWADFRPQRTLTLESLMTEHSFDRIDVLKLDCEGSEYSILGKTPSLDRIRLIVGEYHGRTRFDRLVAERFAGWELRILHEGDTGIFWLKNPGYGQSPLSPAINELRNQLSKAFRPSDVPSFETLFPYYRTLFELVHEWKPNRIVEIGVSAGYSSFTMLLANPDASVFGIEFDADEQVVDTHGGRKGNWRHARELLRPFHFQLLIADSHLLQKLPEADLVYVDGDHSYRGCLADLRLAHASADRILVDDYDSIPSVRQACDTFFSEHPEFARKYIDNGLTGFLVLERRRA